jgi:hypothetical protein
MKGHLIHDDQYLFLCDNIYIVLYNLAKALNLMTVVFLISLL